MWLAYLEYQLRPVPGFRLVQPWPEAVALRAWHRNRHPPPPRSVKTAIIREHASPARSVFVETGTFYGDMLAAVRDDFERLYSIELSPRLAERARRRFAGDSEVSILEGDSGELLGPLLRSVASPAVLWLDGHFSGRLTARGVTDTPIVRELEAVFEVGTTDDVLLIDDMRAFGKDPAYPEVEELRALLRARRPRWRVTVEDDVLRAGAG